MECWGFPSFFNGMLGVSKPRALNCNTLFCLIPLTLFVCRNQSNLNSSSSFRIPGFSALQADGTHSRPGMFSTDITDASLGVIIIVRQSLSFSELSTSSLSSLDLYSGYVGVNIFLNDSSLLSFFNVYAPSIRSSPKDSRNNFFSSYIFSPMRKRWIFRASASASASTEKGPFLLPASTSAPTSLITT